MSVRQIARMHTCKSFRTWAVLCLALCLPALVMASSGEWLAYVSDAGTSGGVYNLFAVNLNSGIKTQLTDNAAIDNHPSISSNGQWVVWSSTRGNGEFDLYLGNFTNLEATAWRLTDDLYTNGPQTKYPDRHCHFRSDGRTIIFTSKNRPLDSPITVISECCVPKIIDPPRFYEGLNVIVLDDSGTNVATYRELDIRDAWDRAAYPGIWTNNSGTYAGHPAFSPDGSNIVFSGSVDGDGKVWEVYTVAYDAGATNLVPNSLRRRTFGPVVGKNPIQLSGGAHFSHDGARILFSSTRTPGGNSQIFSIPADATDAPVTSARRHSFHAGNDYVPEPISSNKFVVITDLGANGLSSPGPGPTADLDLVTVEIVALQLVGTRTDLVAEPDSDEMLLIADEVSWFCGLKPNLTGCTYQPRTFSIESLYLEKSAWLYTNSYVTNTLIPSNLLAAFGYPDQAVTMYATGWENMDALMSSKNPSCWEQILSRLQQMHSYFAVFPGLNDAAALRNWMQSTESTRNFKVVVPSVMYDQGIGANGTGGILFNASTDYDGDARSDLAVYRDGYWSIYLMAGRVLVDNAGVWGGPTSILVPGDYDGDGKSDLAVYGDGYWSIYLMAGSVFVDNAGVWGGTDSIPVPGDYDGDGKADLAVNRDGYWSIYSLASGIILNNAGLWGGPGWTTVPGDYDGDGKSDLAVYRDGYWSIFSLANGIILNNAGPWGGPSWTTVAGDYDGDGKSDLAVYRDGYWSIYSLASGIILNNAGPWGGSGWTPVPGDYDGDGKADLAVYRDGYWSIYSLASGIIFNNAGAWGGPGWTPVR